ncbi:MAG: sugar fermentation stimulation protein SfsA [Alphaproteobacteria bacterium 41-28]|nr:MAG: sugar fermentation stimulation protein SfsA [Alphaproteobacteria bacterium 41-28]
MLFYEPLQKGHLIKRYKRFLADIELEDGTCITAHCPNSGAMQGLTNPGTPVWMSTSPNPNRKLPYTWEMAEVDGTFVGMNTSNPNHLVEEAIHAGVIQELQGYESLRREVAYGKNSRIDILLQNQDGLLTYVEVKNVHLRRGKIAAFPSSVTARGAKHMRELIDMVRLGHNAYVVYVVQRNDCEGFEIADDIDPIYGEETSNAIKNGVIPLVYACEVTPDAITITHRINLYS